MSADDDYLAALDRLERDEPQILPKGTLISNDTTALEAGRKRGSIKRLRHPELCRKIDEAAERQRTSVDVIKVSSVEGVKKSKSTGDDKALKEQYKTLERDYKIALQRNISLVYEVFTLKKKIADLEKKGNEQDTKGQGSKLLNFPKP
ncbi:hypothetical protein NP572_15960 [Pseudomonas putida]|uniref:hypothetical protein n=1 Tax=Pseudomonas putida TaxID=303 RepID=UPI0023649F60|nr:hypothetical protein [Pseudomonas putida]MDD2037902.1 hypothetical protein [Pseudomonas putida]MDD2043635.1 hypothetical protein [Pseudomonas putida]